MNFIFIVFLLVLDILYFSHNHNVIHFLLISSFVANFSLHRDLLKNLFCDALQAICLKLFIVIIV